MSKIWKLKKPTHKKKLVIIAATAVVLAAGAGAGVFFMIKANDPRAMAADGTAQSAAVERGNISKTVIGTGNLESDTALNVYLPTGIEVKEIMVESGDSVEAGDVLATLDETSLKSALLTVQEEIVDLDEDINDAADDSETESVTTKIAGRVKKIYVSEDASVADTMLEHGALMILSLDGKMAVELENVSGVSKGDSVTVTLSDDTEKTGTVASLTGSSCIVTLTDNGPELDEKVTVSDSDGKQLGTGNLYIYEALAITGVAGNVYSISVSENESVSVGSKLLTLDDLPGSSEYQKLITQRTKLEEKLQRLLILSQTNSIIAEYAGTIQDINVTVNNETSGNSSATGVGNDLANATDYQTTEIASDTNNQAVTFANTGSNQAANKKKASAVFTNVNMASVKTTFVNTSADSITIEKISEIRNLITNPVRDAVPQTQIEETAAYNGSITWDPVCETFQGSTLYTAIVSLTAKSGYRFDESSIPIQDGAISVTEIAIGSEPEGNSLVYKITFSETAAVESESETTVETETKTEETDTGDSAKTGNSTTANTGKQQGNNKTNNIGNTNNNANTNTNTNTNNSSGEGSAGNMSAMSSGGGGSSLSGASGGSSTGNSSADDSNDLSEDSNYITAFTISPRDNMLLTVKIDELDILSVSTGQEAIVTFEAIEKKTFSGSITKLSNSAASSDGTAKYEAVVMLPNDESMRAGMSASATITIENKEDILLIPVNALQERGNRVFVYTQQDSESGELSGEVEVETGLSDGLRVEIVGGLSEGDTIYYTRIASSNSNTMSMGGEGFMMREFSGERPRGNMVHPGGGAMPEGVVMPEGGVVHYGN